MLNAKPLFFRVVNLLIDTVNIGIPILFPNGNIPNNVNNSIPFDVVVANINDAKQLTAKPNNKLFRTPMRSLIQPVINPLIVIVVLVVVLVLVLVVICAYQNVIATPQSP